MCRIKSIGHMLLLVTKTKAQLFLLFFHSYNNTCLTHDLRHTHDDSILLSLYYQFFRICERNFSRRCVAGFVGGENNVHRQRLRSTDHGDMVVRLVPCANTDRFSQRAFSVSGPNQ